MTRPTLLQSGFGLRRLPLMLQTENTECGLACLGMVAGYHGQRSDLASLRRRFAISQKGATLAQLIDIAGALGLAARPLRLEIEDLPALRRPCILHWGMNHFVVLRKVGRHAIWIHDPASGARRVGMDEVSRQFTGVALELWPGAEFRTSAAPPAVRLRDLVGRVHGLVPAGAQVLVLALAIEAFALAAPFYLQWVIDRVLVAADRDLLATLALGFGLLMVLQQVFTAARSWVLLHAGANLQLQWGSSVFAHLLRLPVQYFERRHLGDVVSRFGAVDQIQRTLTTAFFSAVIDGLMSVLVLVMMFLYSPPLAWIAVGAMLLYTLVRLLWFRPLRDANEQEIVHQASQQSHFLETVRGVRAVKLFQRQNERLTAWLALMAEQVNANVRGQRLLIGFQAASGLLFGLVGIAVLWLGAHKTLDGVMTVGALMAFKAYQDQFDHRVTTLIERIFEFRMLRVQAERLADVVLTPAEPRAPMAGPAASLRQPAVPPTVRLENLRFRYADTEPWVVDGISLEIPPGQSVVFVGPSGCGKTTLVNLLLGVLTPVEGDIHVGPTSLRRSGGEAVRPLMAAVMQDDVLFAGSIADNIAFFDPAPDRERIAHCAALAQVHEDIDAMPMGYHTLVGDMGAALSGGQKQRIFLARALYRQPRILVLDEATSHLDLALEQAVNAAVQSLALTRILVAHRPETIRSADRVVRLVGGRVVEDTAAPARPAGPAFPAAAGVQAGAAEATG